MTTTNATRSLMLALLFGLGLAWSHAAPTEAQRSPLDNSLQCVEAAGHRTLLIDSQLDRLCVGAPTPAGPLDCFVEARALLLMDEQAITLCRCSPDAQPVACYREVRDRSLTTQDEIVALCSPSLIRGLGPSCR